MVVDFIVSEQDSCVQGHFPSAPVVPGAYLLAKVDLVLRELMPQEQLDGFTKVKFLTPLLPDCRATIAFEPLANERMQIRISHQQTLVMQAVALLKPRY